MTQWIPTSEAWAHVAFYEHDKAQRKIFAELIGGNLLAWAEFYTFNNAEHRDTQMPQAFWDIQWTRLDFTSGKATRAVFDCFASIDARGERVVRQHSSDSATGIHIDRDALLILWPPLPGTEKPKEPQRHAGGRPGKADWPSIEEAVRREIALVGFPGRSGAPGWRTQADVIAFVIPLLGEAEVSSSTLKAQVAGMLDRAKTEMAGN